MRKNVAALMLLSSGATHCAQAFVQSYTKTLPVRRQPSWTIQRAVNDESGNEAASKKIKNRRATKGKAKASKTKRSSSASNDTESEELFHWRHPDDPLVLFRAGDTEEPESSRLAHESHDNGEPLLVRFRIRGRPRPLQRHRTSRGFMYNPSYKFQTSFRSLVHDMFFTGMDNNGVIVDDGDCEDLPPMFAPDKSLAVTIAFRMKRPKKHFVGSKQESGRLREKDSCQITLSKTDVDNLAKFVLDSLIGVMYEDDRQIISLHVTKLFDNDDACLGSTEVCIRVVNDQENLDRLLERSFHLF